MCVDEVHVRYLSHPSVLIIYIYISIPVLYFKKWCMMSYCWLKTSWSKHTVPILPIQKAGLPSKKWTQTLPNRGSTKLVSTKNCSFSGSVSNNHRAYPLYIYTVHNHMPSIYNPIILSYFQYPIIPTIITYLCFGGMGEWSIITIDNHPIPSFPTFTTGKIRW